MINFETTTLKMTAILEGYFLDLICRPDSDNFDLGLDLRSIY